MNQRKLTYMEPEFMCVLNMRLAAVPKVVLLFQKMSCSHTDGQWPRSLDPGQHELSAFHFTCLLSKRDGEGSWKWLSVDHVISVGNTLSLTPKSPK